MRPRPDRRFLPPPLRLVAAVNDARIEEALERSPAGRLVATVRSAAALARHAPPDLAEGLVLSWHFAEDAGDLPVLPPEWALLLLMGGPGRRAVRLARAFRARPRTRLMYGPWIRAPALDAALLRLALTRAGATGGTR